MAVGIDMVEWGRGIGGIPTWGENHDEIVIHSAATLSTCVYDCPVYLMCDVWPASPTHLPTPVQPLCCATRLTVVHVPYALTILCTPLVN